MRDCRWKRWHRHVTTRMFILDEKKGKQQVLVRRCSPKRVAISGPSKLKWNVCVSLIWLVACGAWLVLLRHVISETPTVTSRFPRGPLESEVDLVISASRHVRMTAIDGTEAETTWIDSISPNNDIRFSALIQSIRNQNETILTRDNLLSHVDALLHLAQISVHEYGSNWTMADLCHKPIAPIISSALPQSEGAADALIRDVLGYLIPCTTITPLDCFWEGSIPLGPFPPHDTIAGFIPISWQSFDPQGTLALVAQFNTLVDSNGYNTSRLADEFRRTGITHGYQGLPCIDPLNKSCPKAAPNYVDVCDLVKRFLDWNDIHMEYPQFPRIMTTTMKPVTKSHDYDAFYDTDANHNESGRGDKGGGTFGALFGAAQEEPIECRSYSKAITNLLHDNESLAYLFLPRNIWKDYGKYLTAGCHGFAEKVMQWPEELIFGGREPKNTGEEIQRLSTLQTIIVIGSAEEVYTRFAIRNQTSKPNMTDWSVSAARFVIKQWQRKFRNTIYNWRAKTREGQSVIHTFDNSITTAEVLTTLKLNFYIRRERELLRSLKNK